MAEIKEFPNNDRTFRLEEMEEAMEQSIENAKTVLAQEQRLVEIIQTAEEPMFDEFIKEQDQVIKNLEKQVVELSERKRLLNLVNCAIKGEVDFDCKTAVNTLLIALGIFND